MVQSFDNGWLFKLGTLEGADAPGYADSGWRTIDLPHDWSIEDLPGGSDDGSVTNDPSEIVDISDPTFVSRAPNRIGPFDKDASAGGHATGYVVGGEGWYRKHFDLANLASGDRVILSFGGIYCNSDVWLNGQHLGFHPNGYTPFWYDLTPYVKTTGNVLAIRVRNTGQTSRYYSGSGIYRHTTLTTVKPVHVPWQGVSITTPQVDGSAATVQSSAEVSNRSNGPVTASVRITLIDPSGKALGSQTSAQRTIESGGLAAMTVTHYVTAPQLWSPDSPSLYKARVEVLIGKTVTDRMIETFGVRSIEFNSRGFRLNGQTIKMRGACIHGDHGPLGSMMLYAAEERRVRTLKQAGFNAIRWSHDCPPVEFLNICDRVGMLVYDEFTDMWDGGKKADDYHLYFAEWWKRDAESMIRLDRNHPSVVMRSIGNEIGQGSVDAAAGPAPAERGAEMAAYFRQLDPSRPVCQGGGDSLGVGSSSADYADLGDVHYERDYVAKAQDYPGKAWVQSESYIASLYDYWQMAANHDFAVGDFSWTGWDYLGEVGIGHPLTSPTATGGTDPSSSEDAAQVVYSQQINWPWVGAGCGDIDHLAQFRPQMRYRRVVWGMSELELLVQRPTLPVESQRAGWAWMDELESWTWPEAKPLQPMTVRVFSTANVVTLTLNGATVGTKQMSESDKRIATFVVPYTAGILEAVASSGGQEVARKRLVTAGTPVALRLRPYKATVTTSRDDLAYVVVEVVDFSGNLVPDAVLKVQFDVSGGTLAGVINGNVHNPDSMQRPRRWTYHGKALAVIRPPKSAGTISVTAFGENLQGTTLSIPAVDGTFPAL